MTFIGVIIFTLTILLLQWHNIMFTFHFYINPMVLPRTMHVKTLLHLTSMQPRTALPGLSFSSFPESQCTMNITFLSAFQSLYLMFRVPFFLYLWELSHHTKFIFHNVYHLFFTYFSCFSIENCDNCVQFPVCIVG